MNTQNKKYIIQDMLFGSLPKNDKDEFFRTIGEENYLRLIMLSIIYIVFEVNIVLMHMNSPVPNNAMGQTVLIIVFHFTAILIALWLRHTTMKVHGIWIQVFMIVYCAVLIFWSIKVSLDQVVKVGSITMFVLTLTSTSALFYRRPITTIITNIGMYIYFARSISFIRDKAVVGMIPSGKPPFGKPPTGMKPPGMGARGMINIPKDIMVYIADALLMTIICCVLGIIIYNLRRKAFLEHKRLEGLTMRDSMTNLYNHKTICDLLNEEVTKSNSPGVPISLFMTDIDHFKKINDTHGHQVGDEVIMVVSKLLEEASNHRYPVGRYGGEEFLVVLSGIEIDDARNFGESFRKKVELMDFGLGHQVTMSGGIATYTGGSAEELIKQADAMLYRAKEKGRNCIV